MKALFTGSSSFTGLWFIRALSNLGVDVISTFRSPETAYSGIRAERLAQINKVSKSHYSVSFGDDNFIRLIQETKPDIFCHHGADATNYKSEDFDFSNAISQNTRNVRSTLSTLSEVGCQKVVLTGSVFEAGEGSGDLPLRAFNPYGLSKTLTSTVFEYFCSKQKLPLGKFVIPNPFGPFEEERFTAFLIKTWYQKKAPDVRTPSYVRDNIHVDLLAHAYADFTLSQWTAPLERCSPSGYVESQGAFAERFASEMRGRLKLPCELNLFNQTEFPEPIVRINTNRVVGERFNWNEAKAWDDLAAYYRGRIG